MIQAAIPSEVATILWALLGVCGVAGCIVVVGLVILFLLLLSAVFTGNWGE